MLKCNSCHNWFYEPGVHQEVHTEFPRGDPNRVEEFLCCPICQSDDYDEHPLHTENGDDNEEEEEEMKKSNPMKNMAIIKPGRTKRHSFVDYILLFFVIFIISFLCVLSLQNVRADLVKLQGQQISDTLVQEKRLADLDERYAMLVEAYDIQQEALEQENNILKYDGKYETTAYCLTGTTASGYKVMNDITVAADPKILPIGSKVYIEDVGVRIVHDTGGDIKGKRLDIWFADYNKCIEWGRRPKKVWRVD